MNIESLFANPVSTGYQLGATQPTGEGLVIRKAWFDGSQMEWSTPNQIKPGPLTQQEVKRIRQLKGTGKPKSPKMEAQELANYQFVRDLLCEVPRLSMPQIEQRCKGRRGLCARYLADIKCALLSVSM